MMIHTPPAGVADKAMLSPTQRAVAAEEEYTGKAFTVIVVEALDPPLL
tara:strand:+ start:190 stop:333 length:144 start_codon:yes stop_codon:yes gene_type:complete